MFEGIAHANKKKKLKIKNYVYTCTHICAVLRWIWLYRENNVLFHKKKITQMAAGIFTWS